MLVRRTWETVNPLKICAALAPFALTAILAACKATQAPGGTPGAMPAARTGANIFWNKPLLRLRYPGKSPAKAILSYYGPDGYYTELICCKQGGKFSATAHRHWGNPSGYLHVVYWFKALTDGPDRCAFSAVLNNTGSPPIAIIQLDIKGK
jgi:hypothetical protein